MKKFLALYLVLFTTGTLEAQAPREDKQPIVSAAVKMMLNQGFARDNHHLDSLEVTRYFDGQTLRSVAVRFVIRCPSGGERTTTLLIPSQTFAPVPAIAPTAGRANVFLLPDSAIAKVVNDSLLRSDVVNLTTLVVKGFCTLTVEQGNAPFYVALSLWATGSNNYIKQIGRIDEGTFLRLK
jgi:hypothetical protein